MYTLFILFFASLFGIMFMIGRKLAFVRNTQILGREDVMHPFVPDLEKIKHLTRRGIRAYGYITLVIIIKLYVKSSNLTKQKFQEVKLKVKDFINKRKNGDLNNSEIVQEDNMFLKRMTEFKHKIREIKHKITKEEEKNM